MAVEKTNQTHYIFKVTVLTESDIVLADLGGVRLSAQSTVDLGKKFGIERIKASRSLAENIWAGKIWAWDSEGNQIGGWDLCEVETNLANSCDCNSSDIAVVFMSGCLTDIISDYVAIKVTEDEQSAGIIYNAYQEDSVSDQSPYGTWWALPNENLDIDPLKPTINYLKSLNWSNFNKFVDELNDGIFGTLIYMVDRKTGKYYIFKFISFDRETGELVYIRQSIKESDCEDNCKKINVVFGTNVPDACDTYLYNNFGVSSNISPYLVSNGQYLSGLTLAYQSSSIKNQASVPAKDAQIFSPYRLWIEIDGSRKFYIPLPGGDWTGRYLDICNPSPLKIVEFFEGRSSLWYSLYEFYSRWKEQKDKLYDELLLDGCIIGIYTDGTAGEVVFPDFPREVSKYSIDTRLQDELANAANSLNLQLYKIDNLFSTGVIFYDEFIKILYVLQKKALFSADKVSVYIDCNELVEYAQVDQIKDPAFSSFIYCQSVSNVQLTLTFSDLCEMTPIDSIDGRIWGKITDENGVGISNANVSLDEDNWSTSTDSEGIYIFDEISFGAFSDLSVNAEGYESQSLIKPVLTKESPSYEVNFELSISSVVSNNIISGYVLDEEGNAISNAAIEITGDGWSNREKILTDVDGYYEYGILGTGTQMINVYVDGSGFGNKGASAQYDGVSDIQLDFTLSPAYTLGIFVVGAGTDPNTTETIEANIVVTNIWTNSSYWYSISGGSNSIYLYDLPPAEYTVDVNPISDIWMDTQFGPFELLSDTNQNWTVDRA